MAGATPRRNHGYLSRRRALPMPMCPVFTSHLAGGRRLSWPWVLCYIRYTANGHLLGVTTAVIPLSQAATMKPSENRTEKSSSQFRQCPSSKKVANAMLYIGVISKAHIIHRWKPIESGVHWSRSELPRILWPEVLWAVKSTFQWFRARKTAKANQQLHVIQTGMFYRQVQVCQLYFSHSHSQYHSR